MRTPTQQELALFLAPAQTQKVICKVEISLSTSALWGGETWQDMTDFSGADWVLGVNYERNIDQAAATATVQFRQWVGTNPKHSLSPLMENTTVPAGNLYLAPWKKIRISTATVPIGTPKTLATFRTVFIGRIDSWSMAKGVVTVKCRDRIGELQDAFILYERSYGSDTPVATPALLEDVMQSILDNDYNTTTYTGGSAGDPFTLYSRNGTAAMPFNTASDSPGFSLRRDTQQKMSVWQALRTKADNIEYDLRFRYHEGVGIDDFVLVLEEPERSKTTADVTIDASTGSVGIDSAELDIQDVRNLWRVSYARNGGELDSYEDEDTVSQTKYGFRPAELIYGSSSDIDTVGEATTIVDSLLLQTGDPTAGISTALPYAYFLQVNDLIELLPDNINFDTALKLAVVGLRHNLSPSGHAQTSVTVQGVPKSGLKRTKGKQRMYEPFGKSPKITATSVKYGGIAPNSTFGTSSRE